MKYGELKNRIIDLGFEEDDVLEEYGRIIRNAINHASAVIYSTIALQMEGYLLKEGDNAYYRDAVDVEFETPNRIEPFTYVTAETTDDTDMNVPRILEPLLPLLAAHYVWLDDDLTKATYYYNEYDSMKNEILSAAFRPHNAEIVGGF